MLNLYYTEKVLGLQEVKVKNIRENEKSYEIEVDSSFPQISLSTIL